MTAAGDGGGGSGGEAVAAAAEGDSGRGSGGGGSGSSSGGRRRRQQWTVTAAKAAGDDDDNNDRWRQQWRVTAAEAEAGGGRVFDLCDVSVLCVLFFMSCWRGINSIQPKEKYVVSKQTIKFRLGYLLMTNESQLLYFKIQ